MIRIKLTNVFADDQAKALDFYTDVLGFVKKSDIPVGQFRLLTVASAEAPDRVELVLEPNDSELAGIYRRGLFDAGMPAAVFEVDDIGAEHERLQELGVTFRTAPTAMGPVTVADLEDTCGNVIQIAQAGPA